LAETHVGRRQFLSLMLQEVKYLGAEAASRMEIKRSVVRPPGALEELAFISTCKRCGSCVDACPENIVRITGAVRGPAIGTPYLKPEHQSCTLCLQCTRACPTGALEEPEEGSEVKIGKAKINRELCLAWNSQMCGVCADACSQYPSAVEFQDLGFPIVNGKICTGCGCCAKACIAPAPAIAIDPLD